MGARMSGIWCVGRKKDTRERRCGILKRSTGFRSGGADKEEPSKT
jgi:hypothetical protein